MPSKAMRPVRARRLSAALALAAGGVLSCAAHAQVHWKSGADPAIPEMSAIDIAESIADIGARAADSGARRVVVQFKAPVSDAQRARLEAAGLTLLAPLGDHAFFAAVTPVAGRLNADAIAAEPTLYSVRDVRREWKLDPFLEADMIPDWAVVNVSERKDGEAFEPVFGAYVTFHKDVDLRTAGVALAGRYGAKVVDFLPPINALVIEIPQSQVKPMAEEDAVQWLEPAIWQFGTTNASNRERTGVNVVNSAPYDLTGAGVSVMVFDGGTSRTTHVDFQGRATNRDSDGLSDHATHVSGTIGGAGVANPLHRGMAPGVTINNYGFEWPSGSDFLYTQPGDFLQDYTDAITNHGVSVANNSIGNNTAPNNNDCNWHGNYGTTDSLIDSVARGSIAGKELIIVWANGNERQSLRCQSEPSTETFPNSAGGFETLAPPANAKNHITVGALYSDDDAVTTFTSWGPSDDGRMKPDISGPGSQHGPHVGTNDNGVTSCSSNSSNVGYSVKSGTSMSAPTVTGIVALMLEDFRNHFTGEPDPIGSTIKALLAHNAADIQNVGPDYKTGYGSVRAQPTIDHLRTGNFLENEVGQDDVFTTYVVVAPGEEFKATLAWNDPPATLNVQTALINNLDLRVFDPNGVQRHVWTLDPFMPNNAAARTQPNTLDNLEQVHVGVGGESVPAGVWRVEVVGTNVPDGPQKFSLCASPLMVQCSSAGIAGLDRALYNCATGMLTASVTDCDLNLDDNTPEQIVVNVTSSSDPIGLMVTLTESGPLTANFRGDLGLTTSHEAGKLQIADGDVISFMYMDADNGAGGINVPVIATASVDCAGPVISNVQISGVTFNSATVTFSTNETATGNISIGTSCGGASQVVNAGGAGATHTVNVSGLAEDTQYFFTVSATDIAQNSATVGAGSCFSFTTTDIPSYFTELFGAGERDTVGRQLTFTPVNGLTDFYSTCFEEISSLPTDPAGGTALSFITAGGSSTVDDGYAAITLTGGAQVSLYGVSYSNYFVGTNGYVTFTAFDTAYSETFANHFDLPRISGHFDDLIVNNGSSVRHQQLADRAVVTWLNVPDFTSGGANTFQIEMHLDGTIRIAWMSMVSTDGISGLSAGGGTPPAFVETDLSTLTNCLTCPGDIDGDGLVGFVDLNLLLDNYGQSGSGLAGDLDGDGDVDFSDLNLLLNSYGQAC